MYSSLSIYWLQISEASLLNRRSVNEAKQLLLLQVSCSEEVIWTFR